MSSTVSSTVSSTNRPTLPDEVIKKYVHWYGTYVVGRDAWTLTVVMKDASLLRVPAIEEGSFWSNLSEAMNASLDANRFTCHRIQTRPIDRCEGGLEFVAANAHIWSDGLYFKGYNKDEISSDDPTVLDWAQMRGDCDVTWLEGRSALLTFTTRKNCLAIGAMHFHRIMSKMPGCTIVASTGFPDYSEAIWVARHIW
jgi:hypothetical protein